jgi:hypothetical protein
MGDSISLIIKTLFCFVPPLHCVCAENVLVQFEK